MSLHKLAGHLEQAADRYGLDGMDIRLLAYITFRVKEEGPLSVSAVIDNFRVLCRTATNTRLGRLIREGYIDKSAHPKNAGTVQLGIGQKTTDFMGWLNEKRK